MAKKPYKQSAYAEKLRDPRWQKLRLEVLQRDEFACTMCGDGASTLMVHHGYYIAGRDPWEYPLECFHTCCEACHHSADATREELKVAIGSMPLEAQWHVQLFLSELSGFGYGDVLCILLALTNPSALCKARDDAMEAARARRERETK